MRLPGAHGVNQGAAVNVAAIGHAPELYGCQITSPPAPHRLGAAFLDDYQDVEFTRPASDAPSGSARILTCDPSTSGTCVMGILATFGRKAWRRPLVDAELNRLSALVTLATQ